MKKKTIREMRQSVSNLNHLLAEEVEITVTCQGGPITRNTQIDRKMAISSHRELRKLIPRIKQGSERLVRKDRDE